MYFKWSKKIDDVRYSALDVQKFCLHSCYIFVVVYWCWTLVYFFNRKTKYFANVINEAELKTRKNSRRKKKQKRELTKKKRVQSDLRVKQKKGLLGLSCLLLFSSSSDRRDTSVFNCMFSCLIFTTCWIFWEWFWWDTTS